MAERDPHRDPQPGDILCAGKTRYEVVEVQRPPGGPASVRLWRTDARGGVTSQLWALNYFFQRAARMEVARG